MPDDNRWRIFYGSDGIHLKPPGTAVVASGIRRMVENALGIPHQISVKSDQYTQHEGQRQTHFNTIYNNHPQKQAGGYMYKNTYHTTQGQTNDNVRHYSRYNAPTHRYAKDVYRKDDSNQTRDRYNYFDQSSMQQERILSPKNSATRYSRDNAPSHRYARDVHPKDDSNQTTDRYNYFDQSPKQQDGSLSPKRYGRYGRYNAQNHRYARDMYPKDDSNPTRDRYNSYDQSPMQQDGILSPKNTAKRYGRHNAPTHRYAQDVYPEDQTRDRYNDFDQSPMQHDGIRSPTRNLTDSHYQYNDGYYDTYQQDQPRYGTQQAGYKNAKHWF